jgi:hypothetical protein
MALNPNAFTERVVQDFLHYQLTEQELEVSLGELWSTLKVLNLRILPSLSLAASCAQASRRA